MNIRITRTRLALVLGAMAIAIVGASYAAIPASNGMISACKDNKGGLKVIDAEAGQTCSSNQQLLTWNQQGPAGLQGAPGISGYQPVTGPPVYVGSGNEATNIAWCPAGKRALGGGGLVWQVGSTAVAIVGSHAVNGEAGSGWRITAKEMTPTGVNWGVSATAVCALAD